MRPDFMFTFMETFFPIMFIGVFCLVIFVFISTFVKGAKQNKINRNSPTLDVQAKVVAKRMAVRGDHSHTYYYVTFEVPSGDRMELHVQGADYGMMMEGDNGILRFRGTEFLSFTRN